MAGWGRGKRNWRRHLILLKNHERTKKQREFGAEGGATQDTTDTQEEKAGSAIAVEDGAPGAIGIAKTFRGVVVNSRRGAITQPHAVGAGDRPDGVG